MGKYVGVGVRVSQPEEDLGQVSGKIIPSAASLEQV